MKYYVKFLDKNKERIICGNDGSFIRDFPLVRARKIIEQYIAVNPFRNEICYAAIYLFDFTDNDPIRVIKIK